MSVIEKIKEKKDLIEKSKKIKNTRSLKKKLELVEKTKEEEKKQSEQINEMAKEIELEILTKCYFKDLVFDEDYGYYYIDGLYVQGKKYIIAADTMKELVSKVNAFILRNKKPVNIFDINVDKCNRLTECIYKCWNNGTIGLFEKQLTDEQVLEKIKEKSYRTHLPLYTLEEDICENEEEKPKYNNRFKFPELKLPKYVRVIKLFDKG